MRSLLGFVCVVAIIQGLVGFAGRVWFDSQWGFLHRLVDLPTWGYLAVALAAVVVLLVSEAAHKRQEG
ncbi:hypothetical protein SAMN05444920_101429 [Nonomuraea solani]|uniref:Uncharacterized protein n=1 Tax=Nonomuraea solani TaxID=1144553 RepID=A0A1H5U6Z5_9ACTN|nr:hypothetical protein [Nonomuraea solani]SEF70793.1 hypothetical protein SAMN05444920_101429 [Nonomuraea solani]